MIQIQPVTFPLNLGTANYVAINITTNTSNQEARACYLILDKTVTPSKRLSHGFFTLTEEQYTSHGNDKAWIENYVAGQLGVTLI
jgi:hypothetical protein